MFTNEDKFYNVVDDVQKKDDSHSDKVKVVLFKPADVEEEEGEGSDEEGLAYYEEGPAGCRVDELVLPRK